MENTSNNIIGDDALDDDISLIMADYSMPFVSGTMSPNHESLTQSQYAKVVFHDISDSYPTDSDVSCRYSLTSGIEVQEGDFVAVFRVGWDAINEALLKHPALIPDQTPKSENEGNRSGQVLFRADALPKDEQEFYQLCYVTSDGSVCGASVPFQFRRPHQEELCAVEDDSEMVVVRSRTAVAEERLRKVVQQQEELCREKSLLEVRLLAATRDLALAEVQRDEARKDAEDARAEVAELREVLEGGRQRERQVAKLQQEVQTIDEGRSQASAQLRHSQQHVLMLTSTVETLSADKARMAGLLRENVRRGDEVGQQLTRLQEQLEETRAHAELQAAEVAAVHQKQLAEVEKRLAQKERAEQSLLREVIELRDALTTAERQRRDLGLLREHRASLEQQLEVSEQRLGQQAAELAALRAREGAAGQRDCQQCESAGEQLSLLEAQVRDLRLRLDLGAEEYRKVYVDKCRAEKKLARAAKQPARSKEAAPQPANQASPGVVPRSPEGSSHRSCPMCTVTFPPGCGDLYTQHFDNHLS